MKTIFATFLLGLLINTASARAAELSWLTDLSQAQTQAKAEKKSVLLVFSGSDWCPPCVEEMPSLNKFAADFKDKGVVVLGVSVDKDAAAYKNFIRNLDPAFLTARDPDMKINLEYGTVQYPETYIIDSHGKVVNKIISSANWTDNKMVSYVQSLL